jgi:Hint domain-containing protein
VRNHNFGGLRRTRRNLLAAGGLLAGAALSQIGIRGANAGGSGASLGGPPDPVFGNTGPGGGNTGPGGGNTGPGGGGGPACFLRGTCLLTPTGERVVEDLRIGDLLTTLSGETKPIQWIGRRVYKRAIKSSYPKDVWPVRVARGALGPDAPCRDLFVSQQHALWVDGILSKAIDLINGSTIAQHSAAKLSELEYLNVKLAHHDLILAEGATSETLLVNSGDVERFDNFVEYLRLFGKNTTEETPCAPIAFKNGRDRLLSRLRSAASPWFDCRNDFDVARDRIEERADLANS